ncbi:MAG: bifunctional hydroxymethylpyrimidine kinase/phosphomethylpyrimidine kinase [Candidatus Adiutrix sp.]|nr:bifunctional hydroxymethylpyrimidine kinase/phosphomethylpyrimidine kinase [Candidatus Adiutrix sp.]
MFPSEPPAIPLKCALIIASSDSGGGAGLQADLKTLAANGVYGFCVISAVTAQNSTAVTAMECLTPGAVTAQLAAVADDFGPKIGAVKIGLLGNAENTLAVADFLASRLPGVPMVVDPVMVSASGHAFLPAEAVAALKKLLPLAALVTPNIPEAEVLTGLSLDGDEARARCARRLLAETGARNILIKGGHDRGPVADDLLAGPEGETWFRGPRVATENSHGTGCTLSSAICAGLAQGRPLAEAVGRAKAYVTEGLRHSRRLGAGPGPLHHFHEFYRYADEG